MKNAQKAVKRVCDFVTSSNEENAVAHLIEKFILSEKKEPCTSNDMIPLK